MRMQPSSGTPGGRRKPLGEVDANSPRPAASVKSKRPKQSARMRLRTLRARGSEATEGDAKFGEKSGAMRRKRFGKASTSQFGSFDANGKRLEVQMAQQLPTSNQLQQKQNPMSFPAAHFMKDVIPPAPGIVYCHAKLRFPYIYTSPMFILLRLPGASAPIVDKRAFDFGFEPVSALVSAEVEIALETKEKERADAVEAKVPQYI